MFNIRLLKLQLSLNLNFNQIKVSMHILWVPNIKSNKKLKILKCVNILFQLKILHHLLIGINIYHITHLTIKIMVTIYFKLKK
jgi:hypothetical protein